MTAPIRLLAIIEAYDITGPAKNLLEFATLARSLGVETTIATFTRGATDNLFIQTARGRGIPVETIPETGPLDPGVLKALADLVERLRPDIVQTHAVKSHFLARRANLHRMAPWVAFHHGYTWPTLRARFYNQLDRWSLRAPSKVVTVSLPFRKQLTANGVDPSKIYTVHNAIPSDWGTRNFDSATAKALRQSFGIGEDRRVILIVGRLSREKDHLTLLEAARLVLDAGVPAHVLIVGEGPERPRIEEAVRRLNMTDRVTLAGHQSSAESCYWIADLAVLSSLTEGSPNALLEAMAAGIPVVATRVGGIPEIVADGESALLVNPRQTGEMSRAMLRILQNEPDLAQRLVERGRELIRERHAPESRASRIVAIYRDLT